MVRLKESISSSRKKNGNDVYSAQMYYLDLSSHSSLLTLHITCPERVNETIKGISLLGSVTKGPQHTRNLSHFPRNGASTLRRRKPC